ncbi:MAG TPA: triple tyrosine motif-containing protein, partial [Thermodesulfobacteriota bacterium]|nr:triple tyrosine motif-containing protein [Thermodesulfobacteriota bacterium]
MKNHRPWVIFVVTCVTFSALPAGLSLAESSTVNSIIAGKVRAACDLRRINVRISPSMITAGNQLSSMDYMVSNYSSTAWSGTVNVKVYIFEEGKSVTSGTLIQSHSFEGNFTAKSSQLVKVQNPVIIPPNIPTGNYKIGVFLDILDLDTSNNADASGGARHIWVDAETIAPAVRITAPTSNPLYPTSESVINVSGTASDNVGVTEVTWVNSSTGAAGIASGSSSWAIEGIALKTGSNPISVTAKDAAGNKGTAALTVMYTPADTDPPHTTITSGPTGATTSDSATFAFTGSDNQTRASDLVYATFLQGHDTGWSGFSSSPSITYNNLIDGAYTFQVRAKDQAGNIDPSPASRSFTVTATTCAYSLSAPESTFGPGGGAGTVSVIVPFRCS